MKGLTQDQMITTVTISSSETLEVAFGEESYFDLKKGQVLKYHILPLDKDITNIPNINIEISNS
jgi:hypothetical protein